MIKFCNLGVYTCIGYVRKVWRSESKKSPKFIIVIMRFIIFVRIRSLFVTRLMRVRCEA